VSDDGLEYELDEASVVSVIKLVEEVIDDLDELYVDPKAEAFVDFLENYKRDNEANGGICIFTISAHTASYLQSILQEISDSVYLVSSRQEPAENASELESYSGNGGFLICEDGALKGLEISSASLCVSYDCDSEGRVKYLRLSRIRSTGAQLTILSLQAG
jgi:superfamily II DNA/RNA helicase